MKLVFLTPGTGSYYCGVCMRDNALAKELIRTGHDAVMLPMYLPLSLDESAAGTREQEIFYGGINVYLQQKFAIFRKTPRSVDRWLDARGLLRWVAKFSGMTGGAEIGELTHSMLLGEEGNQVKELDRLIEFLRAERPDAVWLSTALLVGMARRIRQDVGVPVLCSLQGEDSFLDTLVEPWRTRCWEALAERAQDVSTFLAPSRYFAELMTKRMRLREGQAAIVPNGMSLEDFGEPALPPKKPIIGYFARFTEGKGLGLVVNAFIRLKQAGRFPETKLRCAGAMTAEDAAYLEGLKKKLASAGCEQDVEFLPNVTREEKVQFLRTLTFLCVPATYGEAFGLYLIEAMALGVPVIQPRHAAFPEIVEATGGGVLFEPGDIAALVEAWESLLADPERAAELGRAGREIVHRDYAMPRFAERFLEITRERVDAVSVAG